MFWLTISLNLISNFDDKGFKNSKKINPNRKTVRPIGIKISNIEYPIFLREISSLLFIKFLIRNEIAIIVTNGKISFIIEGSFSKDKNIYSYNVLFSVFSNLERSIKLINKIKTQIINKFIKIYFADNCIKYRLILFILAIHWDYQTKNYYTK